MSQKEKVVQFTKPERAALESYLSHGEKNARTLTRARILLLLDEGHKIAAISKLLRVARATVYNVRHKYQSKTSAQVVDLLQDAPRSGRPVEFDSKVEAQVAMIACSDPPEGSGRWTLHLIADRLVKLEVTDSISHESVRQLLKKTG
jgi:putative transposase